MKPEQKFMLSCRQTGKAAGRLSDWLEHNPLLLSTAHAAVCDDIAALAAELAPLAAAAETPPGVALVSTSAEAKSELLFSLLAIGTETVVGELGQRPMDAHTIRNLLPGSRAGTSCAVVRFSSEELPPAPRSFPIRIGLLSIVDIAAIIAGAALASAPPLAPLPSVDDVTALFAGLASQLSAQALPGLSDRDVLDLRNRLNARWPGDPVLATLTAARYWEQFKELAPHLPDRERRQVLAMLWRNDAAYTTLFQRLCDGLDKLGQGADGYCPTEALLGKDKASGWLTRHARSIIDDATLRSITQVPGPMIAMMNRYGQTVDIERSVVAGLISDVTLHLTSSRLNDLAPAELIDFPTAPPIASRDMPSARPATDVDRLDTAVAHYARTKAIYLFERSCQRREITSLVVAIDPEQDDDTYAAAIGDWVEGAQGVNAHARERVRRGLFVAALADPHGAPPDDTQVHEIVRDVLGAGQEWPAAWTPNRPMTEVFWFSAEATPHSPHAFQHPAASTVLATIAPAPGSVAQRSQTTLGELASAIGLASSPRAKQLQLHLALQEKRRHIRQAVLRHHTSNDPSALALWRRSIAVVVQDRLQYLTDQGRLGLLHRALIPAESDLIIPIRSAVRADVAKSNASARQAPWLYPSLGDVGDAGDVDGAGGGSDLQAEKAAAAAVGHWFGAMRRAARSPRLCRELRIEMGVLQNLIDELQIGALRCGVTTEIANAYRQSALPPTPGLGPTNDGSTARLTQSDRDLIRLSAYACRIMTAFMEVLSTVHGRGHANGMRAARPTAYELEVADTSSSGYSSGGARPLPVARRNPRMALDQWEVSFVRMVEDNITSAHVMAGRGDKDRELGELIQLLAPGPFEVEP